MTFNKKMGSLNSILFIILSINLYQFVFHHPVASTDVLIPGDQVNTTSALVSAGGNFTLGFSQFIHSSNSTYLGIWYTVNNRIVWVANRNMPILKVEDGVVLKIEDSGTLKVVNGRGTTLFNIFYNQVGSGNKTRAVLEDSGNFVVYDELNRTLWQSFDHPIDILISGMKLGYNLTTKQNWTLTSWLSDQVLGASGAFTLSLERYQNSPQLLIYRRGVLYWASGPWKDGTFRFLDSFYSSTDLPSYYLSLISDPSGMSVTFQTNEYKLRLNPDGQFDDGSYTPNVGVKFCYGYPSDDGCVVSTLPNCRGQNDSFQWKIGNWIGGPSISDDNSSINLNECMEKCWNKCNCVGFISHNGVGCTTWVNNSKYMQFIEDPSGTEHQCVLVSQKSLKTTASASAPVPAAAALVPADYSSSAVDYGFSRVALAFILIAIVPTSILLLCWCCVMIRRRRRRRREAQEKKRRDDIIHQLIGSDSFNYGDELEKDIKDAPNVKVFSLKAILTATNNFSNENKLGQGGYGPVYKGILPDGREIAVKKLSKTSGQGIGEFKNELILITKLQHTNLVRLYGCCIHPEEKMLVYEFMPNKSLDFFLFVADKKEKIDWQIRFNIIEGVAQGMLYLHKYSRMKVIHRDMKVSNVLLDENMNPKIADFGMARIFQHNVTEAMTNRVVGTYGYMAPEYAMEGSFSIKSDVFSFGVLILEIVSGKKNSTFYNLDRPLNLIGYAWELWKRQRALELKDETLGESFDVKQLLRAIHVGLLCVQEDANDRPTMSEVISMLNNEIVDLPNPKKPAFFTGRQVVGTRSTDYLLDEIVPVSVNGLTITTLEAR